jgi:hypothetical protein
MSSIILDAKGSFMAKKKAASKKANSAAAAKSVKNKKGSSSKAVPKKSSATKKSAARKAVKEPEVSLGRPLVTQEEKLFLLFKDDYHARQIFEFLRVETVKELEQFSPSQIVRILSKPISTTVERIRQRLAEMKRALRDDAEFAAEFREQHPMK